MTTTELLSKVKENTFSSIYSKEDVIKMLEAITEQPKQEVSLMDAFKMFKSEFLHILDMEHHNHEFDNDCIDTSTAEFSLSGNEINLDCVELDNREIMREVRNQIIGDVFDSMEQEIEEKEKETTEN